LDTLSHLEQDISAALRSVRELKNSLPRINRIPSDILSLIPTHLSQPDRFRATFVCRHWRRVFLQYGALWSQLFTRHGEDYVTTLLKRAKGSALDITIDRGAPLDTITLLSPAHIQQMRHLTFRLNYWIDIPTLSGVLSGPLPLLRTLKIWMPALDNSHAVDMPTSPSLFLFSGAVNLEEFDFKLGFGEPLSHFVFPNLATFKLSTTMYEFDATGLFDFLRASPTLRTVEAKINDATLFTSMPQDIIVLPNVETFSLLVSDDFLQVSDLAVFISCPRAKYTSLMQGIFTDQISYDLKAFPDSVSWAAIVHQYSTSPVEQVTFEITDDPFTPVTTYSLIFQSSDTTVIRLGFELGDPSEEEELAFSREEVDCELFSRACRTILDHPLLSHVRRLHIKDWTGSFGADRPLDIAEVVGGLFGSLGPLDELVIHGCDLQIFLPEFGRSEWAFPSVKELTISEPLVFDEQWFMGAIVELAKSQHELEKPFERVTARGSGIPVGLAEMLRQWVSATDCYGL
jgi:hypothetical protein